MAATAWGRRAEYDVAEVDVFSGLAFVWAEAVCALLRRAKKPYVLVLHGGNLPDFACRAPERVEKLLRSAARVTTPSRYLLSQMHRFRSDIELVPNALPLESFRFRVREAPRPRLVWVRAFHRTYNPSLAPRVVALLAKRFPDVTLTMAGRDKGDGSLDETRRAAGELGVSSRIAFPGPVAPRDVPALLDEADVFVNTTDVDNTPVSVLEAMASGLPVVTTDAGGIPWLLEDGRDALLVPRGDAAAMARAVTRVLEEGGLARRLSLAGREKVSDFDWSRVLPRWESLFHQVHEGFTS
jgi:glycosyltransferase involved in cell wall biosynthesis